MEWRQHKKGEHTIYNGKEYRFIESESEGFIELISNNKEDMNYGFQIFLKKLNYRDINKPIVYLSDYLDML
jgi:hypothetical protein